MTLPLILASSSAVRASLLRNAAVEVDQIAPRVDEGAAKSALVAEGLPPRDIADALAELKGQRIAAKHPDRLVLGCDQVLELDGAIFSKPETPQDATEQLRALRGKTHRLHSAAVLFDQARPVWRHIAGVRLTMHPVSDSYIDSYVDRNWQSIRWSTGAYKLEEEGARFFSRIDGGYFSVLGLPLLELLAHLSQRGFLSS